MPETIVALYESLAEARAVVEELTAIGFDREQISLVAHAEDAEGTLIEEGKAAAGEGPRDVAARGALTGGALGGALGFILGAAAVTVPGIGAILVAGPVLAIYGALAGSIGGGLLGLLVQAGVPEEEADYYAEGLRRGLAFVALEVQEQDISRVRRIMDNHNPVNIEERAKEWRDAGWTGYTAEASSETITEARGPEPRPEDKDHRYATGAMDDVYDPAEGRRGPPLPDQADEERRES
jgi:hypothetical protein